MTKSEKCSNSQKNRIVVHSGDVEKRIYEDELPKYIENGWERGISDSHRKSMSDKKLGNIPWNRGTKGIMKANKTSFQKGHVPWVLGKKGVTTSWNKGLTKESSEKVASISRTLKKRWENSPDRKRRAAEITRNRCSGKKLNAMEKERFVQRSYETRAKNNSFNVSHDEYIFYEQLLCTYDKDDIKRQYRDKQRYPYHCDFYIKSVDLFIELNLHWTHGGRPYNPEDEECQKQLAIWQEKAKTSKFYQNAIETWTVRDVKKLSIAKENKLNYKVIYKI